MRNKTSHFVCTRAHDRSMAINYGSVPAAPPPSPSISVATAASATAAASYSQLSSERIQEIIDAADSALKMDPLSTPSSPSTVTAANQTLGDIVADLSSSTGRLLRYVLSHIDWGSAVLNLVTFIVVVVVLYKLYVYCFTLPTADDESWKYQQQQRRRDEQKVTRARIVMDTNSKQPVLVLN